MSLPTVSILGCGWLGEPLARQLVHNGYSVKGSTTTQNKLFLLKKEGVEPYLLSGRPQISGDRIEAFFQSQILVITLPFKRDLSDPRFYLQQIRSIAEKADSSAVEFIVFTSSTSVYPRTTTSAREDEPVAPDNERARVLLETEQLLLSSRHFATTVIRLAGLYGPDRPIARFSTGQFEDGEQPLNIIHRDDAVGILGAVITQNLRGEVLNACSDAHPTRKELYLKAAEILRLPTPAFSQTTSGTRKIVSNEKLKRKLRYQFKFPDMKQILDLVE